MKERLHHFFTYAIFLCADYCFGAIHFNLPNQLTNTIYNINWKNLKQDVENIKKNLIKNALDMSNESILNLKVEILKQPYGNLVCECTETEMSKSLLNLIYGTKHSIFDYLKFINALAGFGQDKDIIQACSKKNTKLLDSVLEINRSALRKALMIKKRN